MSGNGSSYLDLDDILSEEEVGIPQLTNCLAGEKQV